MHPLLDDESNHERWRQARVTVEEPFASVFRLRHTSRYDLLANLENALRLPHGAELTAPTEILLAALYEKIAEAWAYDAAPASRGRAREFVKAALWHIDDEDLVDVVEDLGWRDDLTVTATPAGFDEAVRRAIAGRLAQQVERMLRRLHGNSRARRS